MVVTVIWVCSFLLLIASMFLRERRYKSEKYQVACTIYNEILFKSNPEYVYVLGYILNMPPHVISFVKNQKNKKIIIEKDGEYIFVEIYKNMFLNVKFDLDIKSKEKDTLVISI